MENFDKSRTFQLFAFYFIKFKEQNGQQKLWPEKFIADAQIMSKLCVRIHVSCDMFLVTFACANECFLVKNNLETRPLIEFFFYILRV